MSGYYLSSKSDSAQEAQEVSYIIGPQNLQGQIDFLREFMRQSILGARKYLTPLGIGLCQALNPTVTRFLPLFIVSYIAVIGLKGSYSVLNAS